MIEHSSIIDLIEVQSSIHVTNGSSFIVVLITVYCCFVEDCTSKEYIDLLMTLLYVVCIRLISDAKGLVRINYHCSTRYLVLTFPVSTVMYRTYPHTSIVPTHLSPTGRCWSALR